MRSGRSAGSARACAGQAPAVLGVAVGVGLLTGVAPVAAAATGVLLGGPAPRPLVWAGIAVVAAGLVLGFREGRD